MPGRPSGCRPIRPRSSPSTFDIALKRGILIRGRVTDKATGRPVPGYVNAFPFRDNPHVQRFPGYRRKLHAVHPLKDDGRYEVVAPAGPRHHHLPLRRGADTGLGVGAEEIAGIDPHGVSTRCRSNCHVNKYHVLAEVDIDPKAESATWISRSTPADR